MKPCFTEEKRPHFFTSFFALLFALASQVAFGQTVDCADSDNCGDAYCNFAANIEKGCNCFAGQDNDGDGEIVKAALGCAPYYGLTFDPSSRHK